MSLNFRSLVMNHEQLVFELLVKLEKMQPLDDFSSEQALYDYLQVQGASSDEILSCLKYMRDRKWIEVLGIAGVIFHPKGLTASGIDRLHSLRSSSLGN